MAAVEPEKPRSGLLARAGDMILRPGATWRAIADEPAEVGDLYLRYVAPLAAIPALCAFLAIPGVNRAAFLSPVFIVFLSCVGSVAVAGGVAGFLAYHRAFLMYFASVHVRIARLSACVAGGQSECGDGGYTQGIQS